MIETKLTRRFGIDHPIISAPMAFAAGGQLAAAVTNASGLGLIGGAYGDADWIADQFAKAGNTPVGCGFITWNLDIALKSNPGLLDELLQRGPNAMFLSFGNPEPHVKIIQGAGIPLICQVQTFKDAQNVVDLGVDVVVAQGAEAGGHGERRATMTLVPEVADYISMQRNKTILCAAGGVADGRGLAAALMLGAQGVVIGTRLWASDEALVHPNMLDAALTAGGDDTIRSSVMDIARHLKWPERYTARVLKNAFTEKWHGDISGLLKVADEEAKIWKQAWADGEIEIANTFVGEATGLIKDVKPVADIIHEIIDEAEQRLRAY